jgi:alkylation response protein AidB-like acyl-CoA dehydrogenase
MNFEFSDEQNLLREQARAFLARTCPLGTVRKVLDGKASFDESTWRGMIELGWTATTIPERYEGLGLGHLELCVIAEELGRSLAPTPFSSSIYLAAEAILHFGSDAQKSRYLPKLAMGEWIGTLACAEGAAPVSGARFRTKASRDRIKGRKVPVPDGDVAEFAIVLAQDEDRRASMYLVDLNGAGIRRKAVETLDPTRSHAEIRFSDAPAELLGERGAGVAQLERLFDRAAVLFAFEQVGGAHAALDMARNYALGRFAFGRPIASFQAIKHKLADMYIAATLAHSNSYYGAWALSTSAPELPLAAATARVSATEAYYECSKENIQTHGGMGFTWEFDCHLYYRRAKLLAVNLGGLPAWKDKLVTALEAAA